MNKFRSLYRITAALADAEPMHERLFNQPARLQRPELRALLDRLDRQAARRAVRRDMAALKGSAGTVAHEADAIAAALRAAGLDPEAETTYHVWDQFTQRGLRAALAFIEGSTTTMVNSFKAVERMHAQLDPNAQAAIEAAERLLGRKPAQQRQPRTTAEILADHEVNQKRTAELLARTAPRQTAQPAQRLAVEEIDVLAAQRQRATGATLPAAYAEILAERPDLYERHTAEVLAGKHPEVPARQAQPEKLTPVLDTIERLASDRARRDNVTREQAYSLVLRERPELYTAYLQEYKK